MEGQRDRRDQGSFELQSFWRVLDVVEVLDVLDFPAPFLVAVQAQSRHRGARSAMASAMNSERPQ